MERIQIPDEQVFKVIELLVQNIGKKIEKHGRGAYVSRHESYGILAEEKYELMLALHTNDTSAFAQEAIDIAVACVWAVASLVTGVPVNSRTVLTGMVENDAALIAPEQTGDSTNPQFPAEEEMVKADEEARRLMIERAAKSNLIIAQ